MSSVVFGGLLVLDTCDFVMFGFGTFSNGIVFLPKQPSCMFQTPNLLLGDNPKHCWSTRSKKSCLLQNNYSI